MWTQKEVGQADEEWRIRDLSEEEFGGEVAESRDALRASNKQGQSAPPVTRLNSTPSRILPGVP